MRILHVYKDYYPVVGGIENHIGWLSRAQVDAGHDVSVLVTSLDAHTSIREEHGVRVIRAARLAHVASTPLSVQLPRLLRVQRPDIAHLHFPYPLGELSQWLLGRAQRTVITYHSDVVRQRAILALYRPLLRRVLGDADAILPTSPNYQESSSVLQRWRNKCTVVPLGIPLAPFLADRELDAAELRLRFGTPMVLFVGALRYYKGLEHLLEATRSIPEAMLVVVGEGPMGDVWRRRAAQLGLKNRVCFVGAVTAEELPAFYQACDLFVLPSTLRAEAFGLAAVEAMASGRPVITTALGTGTSYVNIHRKTGLVVPPSDSVAFAEAINHLLSNRQERSALGRAARARAESEFSLELMTRRVLDVYESLLVQPGK